MRWQCSFISISGVRCESAASFRLHFSASHPFEHVDVCPFHVKEYGHFMWIQTGIEDYGIPQKEDTCDIT